VKRLHALAVLTGFLALEVLAWTGPDPSGNPLGTRIDAHVHVFDDRPEFFRLLRRLDLKVVNICVVDKHDKGFEEAEPRLNPSTRSLWVSSRPARAGHRGARLSTPRRLNLRRSSKTQSRGLKPLLTRVLWL
jgi:hypothetical protein